MEQKTPIETQNTDTQEKVVRGENEQNTSRALSLLGIGLALMLAGAAFFSGVHFGKDARLEASVFSIFADNEPEETADMSEFWKVWDLLEDRFVAASSTPLTSEERVEGAIKGLVETYGDPYTVYLPPEDSASFAEEISGNFEGVGMEVGARDGVLTVIAPLPHTPAERAGVKSGDLIVRINGEPTEGLSIDAAVKKIRGEKGTEVVLTMLRDGAGELLDIPVVRDTINMPTVDTELKDGVFIISLFNFSAISEQKMQEALREYVKRGSRKLVLDLRGNPGGFLQSAVNISSYFLPTGKVVVREDFGDGRERVYRSAGKLLDPYAPKEMVILVDRGSASASEIVAGALSEHGVATLVGTQTFGKGSVQELIDVGDKSSLKVTIARWLTPHGNSISEGGLTPVIEVPYEERENGVDPQLDAAIKYLNR